MCQAAHGSGVVTWVGCDEKAVEIEDGDNQLRWFQSSDEAERGFCSGCGSPIFFRSTRWPGELHIARALVSGELDREPGGHSHFDSHVNWMMLQDDLPGKSNG